MCDRCAELEERVAWLESELGLREEMATMDRLRRAFSSGGYQSKGMGTSRIIAALYAGRGKPLSRIQLMERLPTDGTDERDLKLVTVYVCVARKVLGYGAIENLWGRGYRLTEAGIAKVAAILGEQPERKAA